MNLNINLYGGSSILPVFCGESRGTAFYIGEKRFLTAWHVVSDGSEENGADIIIKYERGDLACRLIALGEMDIALLETDVEIDEIDAIPLLKTEFKEDLDLEIIGYPQELGNGLEYFGVRCRNYRKLDPSNDGFDTVVLRTDPFGFHSYSGFSGSPVLNSRGFAVGVVTDQLYNTLGYTSIESVVGELDGQGVAYDDQVLASLIFLFIQYDGNGSVEVSAPIFQQFNPFYVVALTPVSMAIFGTLAQKGKEPSAPRKIAYGMIVAAIAYALMAFSSFGLPMPQTEMGVDGNPVAVHVADVTPNLLITVYLVLTFGELLLSPMGISFVSKVAPPKYKGMMMGGWFVATAIGNQLVVVGGLLWGAVPLWVCWGVFFGVCLVAAIFMFAMMKRLEKVC